MRYRILGPLSVDGAGKPLAIPSQRQRTILWVLLVEANRIVSMERLIDAVWGPAPPATARGQVQICISALRKLLLEAELPRAIVTQPSGYICNVEAGELDLQVFDSHLSAARQAVSEGDLHEADQCFSRALALWRGDPFSEGEGDVLRGVAARLSERRLLAVEEWCDIRLRLGMHQEVLSELLDLVEQFPLRENLRTHLMLAQYRAGLQAKALETYREGRRRIVDELGIEPGEELQRLERAILSASPELDVPPALPRPPGAAAVQAVTATSVAPHLLPADIPDFTGQAELVNTVCRALQPDVDASPGVPVVVLSGKAGIGKSTLAVHVSHQLQETFPDGQLFVKLNGLSSNPLDPANCLERFLRALGVPGELVPSGLEERAELYRNLVSGRRILVVLDDALDEEQVRWLVPGSATCGVIASSRFRLTGLPGVVQLEVGFLDDDSAVKMLAKVIGPARVYGELGAAMQLIELCDRLPLALRIAGARLAARPHWSIAEMVDRLEDENRRLDELVHRGQGVRTQLALTYEGLGEQARRLFRRLGLLEAADFPGWVAAALLDTTLRESDDVLEELIDAQLVDVERLPREKNIRFRLHDLVRAYARERLATEETQGEQPLALRRLLGAWLFLACEAHRREYGGDDTLLHGDASRWSLPDQLLDRELSDPIEWYERERHSIVEAIRQAAFAGLEEYCWDIALTAVTLFEVHRYFDDWRTTHEIALAATRRVGNRRGEAAMLHSLGTLRLFEQRFEEARQMLSTAEQQFGEIREVHGRALALRNLAFLERVLGRLDVALALGREALVGLREVDDRVGEAHVLSSLSQIYIDRGEWEQAEHLLVEAMGCADRTGHQRIRAQLLSRLGEVYLARGNFAGSQSANEQALVIVRSQHDQVGEAFILHGMGMVLLAQTRLAEAEPILRQAEALAVQLFDRMLTGRVRFTLGGLYAATGQPQTALAVLTEALDIFTELRIQAWSARALRAVGDVYAEMEQHDVAQIAWKNALSLADELEPALREQFVARLEERLTQSRGLPRSGDAVPIPAN